MNASLDVAKGDGALLRKALALYSQRRQRNVAFGQAAELFGEPSWDMLLDLFIADKRKEMVAVSSVCVASFAAPTTALRHLSAMFARGLIVREDDARDKRRKIVRLTPLGSNLMASHLAALPDPMIKRAADEID